MPLIQLLEALIVVGVLLWLVNRFISHAVIHRVHPEWRGGYRCGSVATERLWTISFRFRYPRWNVKFETWETRWLQDKINAISTWQTSAKEKLWRQSFCLAVGITLSLSAFTQNQRSDNDGCRAHGPYTNFPVTVTSRRVQAVNYKHRGGATKADFASTDLMPRANGQAKVESKKGYIEIEVEFGNLQKPMTFGNPRWYSITTASTACDINSRNPSLPLVAVSSDIHSLSDATTDPDRGVCRATWFEFPLWLSIYARTVLGVCSEVLNSGQGRNRQMSRSGQYCVCKWANLGMLQESSVACQTGRPILSLEAIQPGSVFSRRWPVIFIIIRMRLAARAVRKENSSAQEGGLAMLLASRTVGTGIVFALLTTGILGPNLPSLAATSDLTKEPSGIVHTNDVKKIQKALQDRGHHVGKVDGVIGLRTRASIRGFQKAENLRVTGQIDLQPAGKLGVVGQDIVENRKQIGPQKINPGPAHSRWKFSGRNAARYPRECRALPVPKAARNIARIDFTFKTKSSRSELRGRLKERPWLSHQKLKKGAHTPSDDKHLFLS
jgi:Putative peptidoglycan binding domain